MVVVIKTQAIHKNEIMFVINTFSNSKRASKSPKIWESPNTFLLKHFIAIRIVTAV